MKLTYTALALTMIMLGLSIYLVFQGNQNNADIEDLESDLTDTQEVVAQTREEIAATREQAQMAAGNTQVLAQRVGQLEGTVGSIQETVDSVAGERDALAAEAALMQERVLASEERATAAEEAAASVPALTPLQRKIKAAVALGQVGEVVTELGFVTITPDGTPGFAVGDSFAIRRDANLVGVVRISAIEADGIIANIVQGSVPDGVTPKAGDAIIVQPAP